MEEISKRDSSCLPLSALRLLVSPIQLASAAVWQTIQQKAVADYGMLEEFVSMVTDIIPDLLTTRQRTQLILGLRARFILELCQFEASADCETVQPHLDQMQTFIKAWEMEAGATNMDAPNSGFVDLVKNMLKYPDIRENFFQEVFPEEYGPSFDEALHMLMWLLLSRLEKLLPFQTFQQVSSMFGEVSSVLDECMASMCQYEELRSVLQFQNLHSKQDRNDGSLDGACIFSALRLPSSNTSEMLKEQAQDNRLDNQQSYAPDWKMEPLTLPQINSDAVKENGTSEIKSGETAEESGDIRLCENSVSLHESPTEAASRPLKQCYIQLERLDVPSSLQSRPVRRNRGLRMKEILLREKRALCEEACKPPSKKTKQAKKAPPEGSDDENSSIFGKDSSYMAPLSNCSEDSWSYYSPDENLSSPCLDDSWSNYSSDVGSPTEHDSLFSSSSVDLPVTGPDILSADTSDIKADAPKTVSKVYCFICKEQVFTHLRTHMKSHFPTGDYACPRCDSRFKLFSSFKKHLHRTCYEFIKQQVDPEELDKTKNLYKCDKCQEAFRYKVSLDRHKLTHHELYCRVCRRVLRDAATLARHKASHTLFQCTRCDRAFTFFMPLLRHCENVHKIVRPFKCNHCPKTSPKLRFLILHEWTHTGHLPFQCAQCSCRFKCDADLIHHQRVHTKEKPYLCAECGKTFSQNSNLLRHLNLIHGEFRNEKKHSCSQCEKSFKEKGALKKHQRIKHLNEVFRHPCPYCGKMVSASTLPRHKLIHTGEKPFKCTVPECDKSFRSATEVRKHVLIRHTTERPYKCDVCRKGFIKKSFLREHAKIHSGEKPFVCHICGKAFLKLFSMNRHKKLVHTRITH